jgi:hypothetical protein
MGELLGGVGLGLAVAVQVGPQVLAERARARRLAAVSVARERDRDAGRRARADVDRPARRELAVREPAQPEGGVYGPAWLRRWQVDIDEGREAS